MGSGARSGSPRGPGTPGPGQPGDRAPARGVDVKPSSREGPVPDTGVRRTRWTSPGPGGACSRPLARIPGSGDLVRKPLPGSRETSGAWEAPGTATPGPAGVVLHQPLAAGPCPRPGHIPECHVATSHSRPPRALSVR